ncbi:hypothetical protein ACFLQ8_00735 [Candidatus Auribacterota bacterium]
MNTTLKNIIVLIICPLLAYYGTWLDSSKVLSFRIPHYPYFIVIFLGALWANCKTFSKINKPVLKYFLRVLMFILFFAINYAISFSAACMYVFPKMDF